MKRSAKIILITTALLTATGVAIVSRDHSGDQHGANQDLGSSDSMQSKHQMQGMHKMENHHAMQGIKQPGSMGGSNQQKNPGDHHSAHRDETHTHN